MVSFFMHNLGAYKVDRKKKCSLYKDVLKEYATVTLELGYPNLFFPGGTRSRSGEVESKLKLGLLGCGLKAYIHNLQRSVERPNVFVIPVNLSYQLVLEAENLIKDYLEEAGKSRSIITDDEFAQPKRVLDFVTKLFELDARIYMTFGQALDCFGNRVDAEGHSYDKHGRSIDTTRYVVDRSDTPVEDHQRDAEYTKELGNTLVTAFNANNTLMSTHLLALVIFELLRRRHRGTDIYRFLREARLDEDGLPVSEVQAALGRVFDKARVLASRGELRLDERLMALNPYGLFINALRHLSIYHSRSVLTRSEDRLHVTDSRLLLYYRNRAKTYGLEAALDEPAIPNAPALSEIAATGGTHD
jgi:glycerol-3-phosphate O-acyltransferase